MKRTIRITIDVSLTELSRTERKEIAELGSSNACELPSLVDVDAQELGLSVAHEIEVSEELLAGSEMYAKVASVAYVSAEERA